MEILETGNVLKFLLSALACVSLECYLVSSLMQCIWGGNMSLVVPYYVPRLWGIAPVALLFAILLIFFCEFSSSLLDL